MHCFLSQDIEELQKYMSQSCDGDSSNQDNDDSCTLGMMDSDIPDVKAMYGTTQQTDGDQADKKHAETTGNQPEQEVEKKVLEVEGTSITIRTVALSDADIIKYNAGMLPIIIILIFYEYLDHAFVTCVLHHSRMMIY